MDGMKFKKTTYVAGNCYLPGACGPACQFMYNYLALVAHNVTGESLQLYEGPLKRSAREARAVARSEV